MVDNIFVQLLFGFPAGILSLALSALGIWRRWLVAMVIAGLWAIPATYYLSAGFNLPLYLVALCQFGAAIAVWKGKMRLAWYLLIPMLLSTLFMTFLTLYSLFQQS